MTTPINLQEFLDGYKKAEIELWDKKRVFREPKMKDIWVMTISEILENYCIEWDWAEFNNLLNELSVSKQKELLSKILQDLGLELMPLNEM
jgi:hypothetical protein